MTAFRSRPALALCLLVGTIVTISLAGLVWAQQPVESMPFDDHNPPPSAQAAPQQPKSAVQQRLEELYKRDHRPLPDYMQKDTAGGDSSDMDPGAGAQSAPAGDAAALRMQREAPAAQGTVRQQLTDYYQSQGKAMPTPTQPAQPSPAPQPAHWYDRINPFHHSTAPAQPQSQSQTQAPGATGATVNVTVQASPASSAAPQAQSSGLWAEVGFGRTSHAAALPSVQLGATAPVEPKAEVPVVYVPAGPSPAGVAQLPSPALASPAVVSIPSEAQATSSPDAKVTAANAVALTDDAAMPFHADSEARADEQSPSPSQAIPYTGLTLEDEQAQLVPPKVEAPKPITPQPVSHKPALAKVTSPKADSSKANAPAAPAHSPATADDSHQTQPAQPAVPPTHEPAAPSAPKLAAAQPDHTASAPPSSTQHHAVAVHRRHIQTPAEKQHLIEERAGQRGLKGFCPVVLRDQRELADSKLGYCSIYHGQKYYFSSAQAQARFESAPHKYAPAAGGVDVVVKANSDQDVEGSLDYALWYKDRLYLFCSPESLQAFSISPTAYSAAAERIQ
jgi:YHS domain-containing protein